MNWLRIGQMAAMNGITEETLRYYDNIGLLTPCHIDPDTGYRFYDMSQSTKLDLIQYMKSLGIQLNDIKKQLDTGDINFIQELLQRQMVAIQSEIQRLIKQKDTIERAIDSYEKLKNYPPTGMVVLEYIQRRYMFLIDTEEDLYHDIDGDAYDLALRKLRGKMQRSNLPYSYFCNVGALVRQDYFSQRKFRATQVYAFVDPIYSEHAEIVEVPASTYLCIYGDDHYQEIESLNFLLTEIEKNGYRIAGDCICEEMAGIPVIKGNHRDSRYRLHVPIYFPVSNK